MDNDKNSRGNAFENKGDSSSLTTRELCNEAFVVPKGKSKEFLECFKAKKTSSSTVSFWDECRVVTGETKE